MITQVEIAGMLKVDVSTVNKILNRRAGSKFRPDTVDRVFKVARKHGYNFGKLKFVHRRAYDRRQVDLDAKLTVQFQDGTPFDTGRARVKDLSQGGARLSDLRLKKASLPVRPFRFLLEIRNVKVEAIPARMVANGSLDLGVAFVNANESLTQKLARLS